MMHYKLSPKTWSLKKVLVIVTSLVLLSVISIVFVDHDLSQFFKINLSKSYFPIVKVFTFIGVGDSYFLISAIGFFLFRYLERKNLHQSAKQIKENFKFMFFSMINSGIAVLLLKGIIGRERPYHSENLNSLSFSPVTLNWDFQSYPSGHTQVGFTMATVFSILFPKQAIYFWTLAVSVGLSRILLQYHFLGDTLAGAAVGIGFTYLTAVRMKKLN